MAFEGLWFEGAIPEAGGDNDELGDRGGSRSISEALSGFSPLNVSDDAAIEHAIADFAHSPNRGLIVTAIFPGGMVWRWRFFPGLCCQPNALRYDYAYSWPFRDSSVVARTNVVLHHHSPPGRPTGEARIGLVFLCLFVRRGGQLQHCRPLALNRPRDQQGKWAARLRGPGVSSFRCGQRINGFGTVSHSEGDYNRERKSQRETISVAIMS
jgi:hypothetical protein